MARPRRFTEETLRTAVQASVSMAGVLRHLGVRPAGGSHILVKRTSGRRESTVRLRRALVESGVPYQCAGCSLGELWNGKRIALQVNHKNSDWLDDRRENLEFLCPNCHSQTPGWCGSKMNMAS